MTHFEIEDIISQDKLGIVFRAFNPNTEKTVAIRRYFPFGQRGGGLNKQQAKAFQNFTARLATIKHETLRPFIEAGVDPIDGMPFIVTEWIEGSSLRQALSNGPLPPETTFEVMRSALEISIILSHALNKNAVWVEADLDSTIIHHEHDKPTLTFWISPFHFLNEEHKSNNIVKLAATGEELAGWKNKLVGANAGKGLGGWLKSIRNNPETSNEEAYQSLMALTSETPDTPLPTSASKQQALQKSLKQQPSKSPLAFLALLAILIGASTLFFLKNQPDKTVTENTKTASTATPKTPPSQTTTEPQPEEPSQYLTAQQQIDQLSARIQQQAAAREAERNARQAAIAALDGNYTPEDHQTFSALPQNTAVKLTGTLTGTSQSTSGKNIYLQFSHTNPDELIQGVIHKDQFQGDTSTEAFTNLIGQKITLDGVKIKEFSNRKLVKITSHKQISRE